LKQRVEIRAGSMWCLDDVSVLFKEQASLGRQAEIDKVSCFTMQQHSKFTTRAVVGMEGNSGGLCFVVVDV